MWGNNSSLLEKLVFWLILREMWHDPAPKHVTESLQKGGKVQSSPLSEEGRGIHKQLEERFVKIWLTMTLSMIGINLDFSYMNKPKHSLILFYLKEKKQCYPV